MKNPKLNCPYCFTQLKKSTHYNYKYNCGCINKYTICFNINDEIYDENFIVGSFWIKNYPLDNFGRIFKKDGKLIDYEFDYTYAKGTVNITGIVYNPNFVIKTNELIPFFASNEEVENYIMIS